MSLILVFITAIFSYKISQPIYVETEDYIEGKEEVEQDIQGSIDKWEIAYRHPLLVSSSEILMERGQRTLSYRRVTEQAPFP